MKHISKSLLALGGLLLSLCGCSGLDALNFITPSGGYTVKKDIAYGADPRQKLDVYTPDQPAAGRPVMLFLYGGSWQTGSKDDYRFAAQSFAQKGYYTVVADYRLYPQVYFPDFMDDSAHALVWTHNHIGEFGGNTQNLFVSGHSSGAYLAVMVTLDERYLKKAGGNSNWIKGTIGIAGPYDFLPFTDPAIKAVFSKAEDADTQPINYVRPHLPPMLLLHGDVDEDVLLRNTRHLTAKLKQFNDPVETHIYPGVAHKGIILAVAHGFHYKADTLADIDAFVTAHTAK